MTFQEFLNLNEFVGVSISKKDLYRVYSIIDRDKFGRVNMEELRNISNLTMKPETKPEENPDA